MLSEARAEQTDHGDEANDYHGDMYLRIAVQVPEHLTPEERELYERLRAISGKTH